MRIYVLRRLLLMIPTLIGISLVCFILIQFVPGGPVEQLISKLQGAGSLSGASSSEMRISAEEIENIKSYYGFDKPAHIRFLQWLKNICQLDFGDSYFYEEPVLDVIVARFPISLFFGLSSFFLSYLVCIPLGIKKAVKHGSLFDVLSSSLVYIGYVIPAYALGILLIIYFAGGSFWNFFPMTGIVSDYHDSLSPFNQILDFLHHMVLPMICYMLGEFAVLTILMKNSLLEEIKKDYMRTAIVKGSPFNRAVFKHAFRNALIPIATRVSEIFTVMFAGALLIEKVFDIDGMGLLFYNSIVNRDYNVVMGMIFLMSIMSLLGKLFSDILYAVIDPRIRFK
ncbi:MAG: ABC transporter permease subunit [Planctomycetes bacterium]|nr:ABC transporter permease subunit [Planctomycetota bacterium]